MLISKGAMMALACDPYSRQQANAPFLTVVSFMIPRNLANIHKAPVRALIRSCFAMS